MMLNNPFTNLPRLSKIVAVVLAVFMVLGLVIPGLEPLLSLNVGYTIPPYFFLWNIVTSGFYESSLMIGVMDILLLLVSGKFLEPIWGSKEFMRFIVVVNAVSGLASFILMVIIYAIIRNEYVLFYSNLCGFGGVIAGFTVAVKQLVPDQEINMCVVFSVKAKHLPGLIVLFGIASFVLGLPSKHLPHVLFGTLGAWVYLRYYQRKGDVVGDLSSSFAFATFWPEPIRPVITVIARILSYPLRLVGIMPTPNPTSSYSSPYSQNLEAPAGPDADRRRALAERAVQARMAHQHQHQQHHQQQHHQTKLTNSQIMPVNNNEISASAEIIPEPTPATLSVASSRPAAAVPAGDKT